MLRLTEEDYNMLYSVAKAHDITVSYVINCICRRAKKADVTLLNTNKGVTNLTKIIHVKKFNPPMKPKFFRVFLHDELLKEQQKICQKINSSFVSHLVEGQDYLIEEI